MSEIIRQHLKLGELRWDAGANSWEAAIDLSSGYSFQFEIVAEGDWADKNPDDLFEIGASFLAWAKEFEPTVRERVADDLLYVYNEHWADDDPDEGPPPYTRSEFLAAIHLCGLSLYDSGRSSWDYDPGELFAGHGIWHMLDKNGLFLGKASLVG